MPNHVHVIVCLEAEKGGQSRPPLQRVMKRSYYDHVIRNEADYLRAWQYIDDNPAHWAEDEYYSE